MWYLHLMRSAFIFLIEAEELGNEPVASASLSISSLLAPGLNILITDMGTDIDDLIGAGKEIGNSKRGKK